MTELHDQELEQVNGGATIEEQLAKLQEQYPGITQEEAAGRGLLIKE